MVSWRGPSSKRVPGFTYPSIHVYSALARMIAYLASPLTSSSTRARYPATGVRDFEPRGRSVHMIPCVARPSSFRVFQCVQAVIPKRRASCHAFTDVPALLRHLAPVDRILPVSCSSDDIHGKSDLYEDFPFVRVLFIMYGLR